MRISRAIAALKRNGWSVEDGAEIVATKAGQRNIYLRPNGRRENDDLVLITIRREVPKGCQFDAACDARFCDTIKEAMEAA